MVVCFLWGFSCQGNINNINDEELFVANFSHSTKALKKNSLPVKNAFNDILMLLKFSYCAHFKISCAHITKQDRFFILLNVYSPLK